MRVLLFSTRTQQQIAKVSERVYLPRGKTVQIRSWQEVCVAKSVCGPAECLLSLPCKMTQKPHPESEYLSHTATLTATGSERDSAASDPSIHTSAAKSMLTRNTRLLQHDSHTSLFRFRSNRCDIFVLTRCSVCMCTRTCLRTFSPPSRARTRSYMKLALCVI